MFRFPSPPTSEVAPSIAGVGARVSYPFAHQAVVEWEAYEVEGRLLDEVGIEDSDL